MNEETSIVLKLDKSTVADTGKAISRNKMKNRKYSKKLGVYFRGGTEKPTLTFFLNVNAIALILDSFKACSSK